jgi:hypothetical protein
VEGQAIGLAFELGRQPRLRAAQRFAWLALLGRIALIGTRCAACS